MSPRLWVIDADVPRRNVFFPSTVHSPQSTVHSPQSIVHSTHMTHEIPESVTVALGEIRAGGLYKTERMIDSPQEAHIEVASGQKVLNMCANNYLGLADRPEIIAGRPSSVGHVGLWPRIRTVHLWHADHSQAIGTRTLRISRYRRHDFVLVLF